MTIVCEELASWNTVRNQNIETVNWQFTTDAAEQNC